MIASATARQSSTADSTPTKPATATTTSTTHHKTTANTAVSATKSASTKSTVPKSSGAGSGATKTSRTHTASAGKHSSRKKPVRARGQQKIDSDRAQAIQEALIRVHYLNGEATGTWSQSSEEAMRRYQADNGWQSKTVPDSRALIKLGLGPSKDHLLNPESAMTTVPDSPRAAAMPTTSHTSPPTTDPTPTSNPNDSSHPQ
jgi:Putative peptidoglycan binding domain